MELIREEDVIEEEKITNKEEKTKKGEYIQIGVETTIILDKPYEGKRIKLPIWKLEDDKGNICESVTTLKYIQEFVTQRGWKAYIGPSEEEKIEYVLGGTVVDVEDNKIRFVTRGKNYDRRAAIKYNKMEKDAKNQDYHIVDWKCEPIYKGCEIDCEKVVIDNETGRSHLKNYIYDAWNLVGQENKEAD